MARLLPLNQISPGQRFRVAELSAENCCACRLMAMGLMPGVPVRLVNTAPLGDPIAVEFCGCRVSLRRADAAAVTVEEVA